MTMCSSRLPAAAERDKPAFMRYALPLILLLASGCLVPKKKYDALQAELDTTKSSLTKTQGDLDAAKRVGVDLQTALSAEQAKVASLSDQISKLNTEKVALLNDKSSLKSSVEEMQKALDELNERKAAAEARVNEYKNLLAKFKSLIDAGKLKVKIVDGRMVVELATDVLFSSGSAALSDTGKAAIVEVSQVLATIAGREFQVEGHTDNVPIKTAQFPSNWELAAARSLTVVKTMIEAGMPANRVSSAAFSEYHPVAGNDTPEGKSANRRIEIVVVPDLSTLPGFDELEKLD